MTDPTTPRSPAPPHDPAAPPQRHPSHPDVEPQPVSTPDEVVDRESEDSFPASDPPSTTPLHIGEPDDEVESQP
ncbi:MAG: hypothetical protein LCH84_03010 [Gemmatimonadetes bacterium]|nr:hypothetical protein [Gemmatimonadota bacterium]